MSSSAIATISPARRPSRANNSRIAGDPNNNTLKQIIHGDKLGFVAMQKGNVEIMYQTFASQKKDTSTVTAEISGGHTFLYVEVDKLDAVIQAMKGAEIAVPVRTTFYGAREIGVKDPAGHIIVFAEFAAAAQH